MSPQLYVLTRGWSDTTVVLILQLGAGLRKGLIIVSAIYKLTRLPWCLLIESPANIKKRPTGWPRQTNITRYLDLLQSISRRHVSGLQSCLYNVSFLRVLDARRTASVPQQFVIGTLTCGLWKCQEISCAGFLSACRPSMRTTSGSILFDIAVRFCRQSLADTRSLPDWPGHVLILLEYDAGRSCLC